MMVYGHTGLNILLVDDLSLVRKGVAALLMELPETGMIHEAGDGLEAIALLTRESVDLVLIELDIPGIDGFATTKIIKKEFPAVKVIALTSHNDFNSMLQMNAYGSDCFLMKSISLSDLQKAIQAVMRNEKYIHKDVIKILASSVLNNNKEMSTQQPKPVSEMEKKIMLYIFEGLTATQIGEKMNISPKTVEYHKAALYHKTGTKNNIDLFRFAVKNNITKL